MEWPIEDEISTHTLRKEGDDLRRADVDRLRVISTHTLRKEGDAESHIEKGVNRDFNPHPPQGG